MQFIQKYDPDQNNDLFEGEPESIWYSSSVEDFDTLEDSSPSEAQQSLLLDLSQELEDLYERSPPVYAWEDYRNEETAEQHVRQNPAHCAHAMTAKTQIAIMSGALKHEQKCIKSENDRSHTQSKVEHSEIPEEHKLRIQSINNRHTSQCIPGNTASQKLIVSGTEKPINKNVVVNANHLTPIGDAIKIPQIGYACEQALDSRQNNPMGSPTPAELELDNSGLEIERVIEQIKSKDTRQALHTINPSLSRSQTFRLYHRAIDSKIGLAEDANNTWLEIQSPPHDSDGDEDKFTVDSDEDTSLCEDLCLDSNSTEQEKIETQRIGQDQASEKHRGLSSDNSHCSLIHSKPHLSDVTPIQVQGHHPVIIPRSPQKTMSCTSSLASGIYTRSFGDDAKPPRLIRNEPGSSKTNILPLGNLSNSLRHSTEPARLITASQVGLLQPPVHSVDALGREVSIKDNILDDGLGAADSQKRRAKINTIGVQGDKVKITKARSTSRKASSNINMEPIPSKPIPEIPYLPNNMDLDLPLPELSMSQILPRDQQLSHPQLRSCTPDRRQQQQQKCATEAQESDNLKPEATENDVQDMDLDYDAKVPSTRDTTIFSTSKPTWSKRRATPYPTKAKSDGTAGSDEAPRYPKAFRSISKTPQKPRSRKGCKVESTAREAKAPRSSETVVAAASTGEQKRSILRRSSRVPRPIDRSEG